MSARRRRRRHYIELGDGAYLATSIRGPISEETRAALVELGEAVKRELDAGKQPPPRPRP